MPQHEYSSSEVASFAGRIAAGGSCTISQARAVLGSGLTQARNRTLPGLAALNASLGRIEFTSERIAQIAGRGLGDLGRITPAELRAVAASVLTQAPDRAKNHMIDDARAPGAHAVYNDMANPLARYLRDGGV